eukprot:365942-Chlamydomonas_euryale.AAC.35
MQVSACTTCMNASACNTNWLPMPCAHRTEAWLQKVMQLGMAAHVLESFYTAYLCRSKGFSFQNTWYGNLSSNSNVLYGRVGVARSPGHSVLHCTLFCMIFGFLVGIAHITARDTVSKAGN